MGKIGGKDLRHIAARQTRVRSPMDLTHATGAQEPDGPVSVERLTNRERHGRRLVRIVHPGSTVRDIRGGVGAASHPIIKGCEHFHLTQLASFNW
jgi:hypothetical protein